MGIYTSLKDYLLAWQNAAALFQRVMDDFIRQHGLTGTYAYLDDIIICGRDKNEHDNNLTKFMSAAKSMSIIFNESKCLFSQQTISYLGFLFTEGTMKPDPARLKPLVEMPIPTDLTALQRLLGLFSYYSKWVKNYSFKIQPLLSNVEFPLNSERVQCISSLKDDISKAFWSSELIPWTNQIFPYKP